MTLTPSSIGRVAMAGGVMAAVAGAMLFAASCSLTTSLDGLSNGRDDAAPGSTIDGAGGGGGDGASSTDASPDASPNEGGGADAAAAEAYRAAVLADAPVGYWRFDETNITMSAKDLSGHGRDGTYSAGVIFGVPGAIANDTAAHFDGVMSLVLLGPIFRFDGAAGYTLEAWVRPDASPGYGVILGRNADPDGYGLYITPARNLIAFRQRVGTSDNVNGPVLDATSFTHVAATYDGSMMRLYANGALVGTASSGMIKGSANSFEVGNDGDGTPFAGDIDEPAVYDHALSDTQIRAHYLLGKGP